MSDNSRIDFSERLTHNDIDSIFTQRWSPRTFDAQKNVSDRELLSIIEAARWAPSCFNEQPWRFIVSTSETFDDYLKILTEGNQTWAKNASRIGFIAAKKHFSRNQKSNAHARFDCGAAWMALALQAHMLGIHSRAMAGIRPDLAYSILAIDPDKFDIVAGFALGYIDSTHPAIQSKEDKPSSRLPLDAILLSSHKAELA